MRTPSAKYTASVFHGASSRRARAGSRSGRRPRRGRRLCSSSPRGPSCRSRARLFEAHAASASSASGTLAISRTRWNVGTSERRSTTASTNQPQSSARPASPTAASTSPAARVTPYAHRPCGASAGTQLSTRRRSGATRARAPARASRPGGRGGGRGRWRVDVARHGCGNRARAGDRHREHEHSADAGEEEGGHRPDVEDHGALMRPRRRRARRPCARARRRAARGRGRASRSRAPRPRRAAA